MKADKTYELQGVGCTNATSQKVRFMNSARTELAVVQISDDGTDIKILSNGVLNDYDGVVSVTKLLSDEKYRIQIALDHSSTNQEAMSILRMNITTFFRKLERYSLTRHPK